MAAKYSTSVAACSCIAMVLLFTNGSLAMPITEQQSSQEDYFTSIVAGMRFLENILNKTVGLQVCTHVCVCAH